jgi:hypothetical protein
LPESGPGVEWRPFFAASSGNFPMLEINLLLQTLKDIEARTDVLRGYL